MQFDCFSAQFASLHEQGPSTFLQRMKFWDSPQRVANKAIKTQLKGLKFSLGEEYQLEGNQHLLNQSGLFKPLTHDDALSYINQVDTNKLEDLFLYHFDGGPVYGADQKMPDHQIEYHVSRIGERNGKPEKQILVIGVPSDPTIARVDYTLWGEEGGVMTQRYLSDQEGINRALKDKQQAMNGFTSADLAWLAGHFKRGGIPQLFTDAEREKQREQIAKQQAEAAKKAV
jgi:hypothetical protein